MQEKKPRFRNKYVRSTKNKLYAVHKYEFPFFLFSGMIMKNVEEQFG